MVTVTKYLTQNDLRTKICSCEGEDKFKILFDEVTESELRAKPSQGMMGAYILKSEKLIICCERCKKIYFISTTFEGGMSERFTSIDSLEIFEGTIKDLRKIINSIFDEYENELITIATDDHTIKVLEKDEDEEKTITRYAYLNREDKDLYRDLFED